jgi:antitoxin VapB
MALSIRNNLAEQLARTIAKETGESITQAIISALQEKLVRLKGKKSITDLKSKILQISNRCSKLPNADKRTPDEILGYNQDGGFDSW